MTSSVSIRDGSRDFDFLFGTWDVHNERLERPLSGSHDWYDFAGTCIVRPVWGGKANMDEFAFDSPRGAFEGMTVRYYDAESGLWRLYWATPRTGLITTPNVGAFGDANMGEFFSEEVYDGKDIVCRYRWFAMGASRCRWEQAFSVDGRLTWETNWTMDFRRK